DRVDHAEVVIGGACPLKPAVAAVMAAPSILEGRRLSAAHHRLVLRRRCLSVVRVDEAQEWLTEQLTTPISEHAPERGIDTDEEPTEVRNAQHVDRERKEAFEVLPARRAAGELLVT